MQPMKLMSPQATPIGDSGLSCEIRNGMYQYWYYSLPYGYHDEDDIGARNLKIATFAKEGVHPEDLAAAFGISDRHVRHVLNLLRTFGWQHFCEPPKRRGPSAISAERKAAAERRLAEGASIRQAAIDAGIVFETLRSNLRKGFIEAPAVSAEAAEGAETAVEENAVEEAPAPLDRFFREMRGRAARMGRGACNMIDRVKASTGKPRRSCPGSTGRERAFATPGS